MTSEGTFEKGARRHEEFVRLFTAHQDRIRAYVYALVPNWHDAEEIGQQVAVVLWRKIEQFDESGGDFRRWACGIAHNEVLHYRRAKQRKPVYFFNDELLATLADDQHKRGDVLELRRRLLEDCVGKLHGNDRHLVIQCYGGGTTIKRAAQQLGRPVATVYKALERIRGKLFECIERSLAAQGTEV